MQKTVSSKIEFAKIIVQVATCFNNIKLSETEITVLSYFIVYGVNQQSKNLIGPIVFPFYIANNFRIVCKHINGIQI